MITFYGSHICSGCREALALFEEKKFTDFTFIEITETTQNLKDFLKLRDEKTELAQAKSEGRICIPCYVREDGSITLETEDIL